MSNPRPTCCYKHGNELGYDDGDGGDCAGKYTPPKLKRSECTECKGTGVFHSGVCHCGEDMDTHCTMEHTKTEMVGPCPYCEEEDGS